VISSDSRGFVWRDRGVGEPVVLLHGLLGDMEHWGTTLGVLARFCRPISVAMPILDPSFAETAPPDLADYVRRFLDALGLSQVVVGGNSLGGHIALELALAHPDRVSGLILTGSSGLFERGFTRGVPHRPSSSWVREKMEEVFHDPALITDDWVESVRGVVTTRDSALRLLQTARAAKRRNIEEWLTQIRVPSLLIWGANDRITPPEVAERFHALLSESELFLLPSCGHAPMLERPEAFNAILASWLLRTRARRERSALVAGRVA